MINTLLILYFLFVHWFADFVCQTNNQAQNKSTSNKALLSHTSIYGLIITIATYIIYLCNGFGAQFWYTPLIFGVIQFITHTLVDYITSRINKELWNNKQIHEFFVMIGFDQFIHYIILFGSLWILFY